jgi:hypothetical protein
MIPSFSLYVNRYIAGSVIKKDATGFKKWSQRQYKSIEEAKLSAFDYLTKILAGGPQSINFDELSSKVFTLNHVSYMTNMEKFSKNIPQLFTMLPIQHIAKQIESRHKVKVDTGLFEDNETIVSKINSYNLTAPNYFVEFDTDASQKVSIHFGKFHQEKDLKADISLNIYENDTIIAKSRFSIFPQE